MVISRDYRESYISFDIPRNENFSWKNVSLNLHRTFALSSLYQELWYREQIAVELEERGWSERAENRESYADSL